MLSTKLVDGWNFLEAEGKIDRRTLTPRNWRTMLCAGSAGRLYDILDHIIDAGWSQGLTSDLRLVLRNVPSGSAPTLLPALTAPGRADRAGTSASDRASVASPPSGSHAVEEAAERRLLEDQARPAVAGVSSGVSPPPHLRRSKKCSAAGSGSSLTDEESWRPPRPRSMPEREP